MTDRSTHFYSVLLSIVLVAAPALAQNDIDRLKAQTVKITVTRPNKPVEYGSGVILCQQNKQVYLLTAHHVLAGKSPQPSGKNTLRLRRISEVEISFYGNSPPPVGKDALSGGVFQVPGEDLLVLSFPLEQVLSPATLDTPSIVDEAADEEDRPIVYSIGFWKDKSESWAHREGTLRPGGGRLIHHSGDIAEGFSGGPLFNEAGALVGINIERVAGQAIGADIGNWYGEALALEEVLPDIDKWVPAKCLKSASPLSELADLTYRRAMRAVSIKRWPRAAELMAEAIEQQPLEGGSVHLEGLRYTPYLPLYHHGLALYRMAGRAEDSFSAAQLYGEAIRQWERSEAQGVIQGNKRFTSLKRLEAKSYRELHTLSKPTTAVEKAAWAAAEERARAEMAAAEKAKAIAEQEAAAELEAKRQATAAALAEAEEQRQREIAEVAASVLAEADEERARLEAETKLEAARAGLRRVTDAAQPCGRLRANPSTGATKTDCLAPGSVGTVLEERNGWTQLLLEDGRQGWMASRLLETPDQN